MPSNDSFVVDKIPDVVDPRLASVRQWAGQMPIETEGGKQGNIFFWLISNSTNTHNSDILTIWLNGGPGCTSVDGVLMENGPYAFDNDKLVLRPYAWSTQMDVLYIDQPFGTGLSVVDKSLYVKSFVEGNDYLIKFLEEFFETFPEYKTRRIYLAGESEAGTYLIYLANSILEMPSDKRYMSYPAIFAEKGLLSQQTTREMYKDVEACVREYNRAPQPVHVPVCEDILSNALSRNEPAPNLCYN
ncbi:Cell death protease, partial [Spiromyces aspiralis]